MRSVIVFFAGNERGGAASHLRNLARTVIRSQTDRSYRFISLGDDSLTRIIRQTGVACDVIHAGSFGAVKQLAEILRAEKNVLLHAHGPRLNILASMAAKRANVPWTSTIHSHPSYDFLGSAIKSTVYPKLHVWSLKRAMGLFVVQSDLSSALPVNTVLDVPNAIDSSPLERPRREVQMQWKERLHLPSTARFIGIAARFDPVKNIDVLIQAVYQLQTNDVHLLIAGDGIMRDTLVSLSETLGVAARVHFLGFVSDMSSFYAALDVHVLPSKSEGTPFAVLEAGFYGAANIGSDVTGLRTLLLDGKAGELVPVGDATALANAIDAILENETRRNDIVEAFSRDVLPKFTPERMLEAYERGYTVLEEDILRSRRFASEGSAR